MPVLIAIAVAVLGFIWWSWGRRRAGDEVAFRLDRLFRRRPCQWSTTGDKNGRMVEYKCATCHVVAYSTTGKPPQDCKRAARGGL